jgi:hypothetical protein
MKIEWTSTTPSVAKVTLGDDAAGVVCLVDGFGGASGLQVSPLFRGGTASRFARGNVSGEISFVSAKSYSSQDTAAQALSTEFGRLNQKGNLEITYGSGKHTLTGANLVEVVRAYQYGLRIGLRYRFVFGTITYA